MDSSFYHEPAVHLCIRHRARLACLFTLVGSGEASKVASYTFLIPLISIVASSMFLHEPLTLSLLVGLLLIVTSICLVNSKSKAQKTASIGVKEKAAQ